MLFEDNMSAISVATQTGFMVKDRSKHIEVRFHKTRELIQLGIIDVQHVPTTQQLADLFTKDLGPYKLHPLVTHVMNPLFHKNYHKNFHKIYHKNFHKQPGFDSHTVFTQIVADTVMYSLRLSTSRGCCAVQYHAITPCRAVMIEGVC